jgi:hypothetical protein
MISEPGKTFEEHNSAGPSAYGSRSEAGPWGGLVDVAIAPGAAARGTSKNVAFSFQQIIPLSGPGRSIISPELKSQPGSESSHPAGLLTYLAYILLFNNPDPRYSEDKSTLRCS